MSGSPAGRVAAAERFRGALASTTLSRWTVALGIAATVGYVVAPTGSVGQTALWSIPFVLVVALIATRVTLCPPEVRRPLHVLLAGTTTYLTASVFWYVLPVHAGVVVPFPSVLDVMFFTSYAFYAAFLVLVLRRGARRTPLQGRLAVIDTAILTLAVSAVLWVAVIEPQVSPGVPVLSTLVALAYPAFQLVLVALTARLVTSDRLVHRPGALLLVAWIGGALLADLLYGVQSVTGTFSYTGPLVPLWMVAYTGLAAFAVHPGLTAFLETTPGQAAPPSPVRSLGSRSGVVHLTRFLMLLVAALVPMVLAVVYEGRDLALLAVATATFGLSFLRASILAGDLSEQRQLAGQLEEALARLRAQHDELARLGAAAESSEDAIVISSPDGLVTDWNHGAELLYGYSRSEALGRHVRRFFPDIEPPSASAASGPPRTGASWRIERVIRRKDRVEVEVEATISSIDDGHGQHVGFVGIARSVTQRKALERELAAHARRLDEAQRLAGVGGFEHDLTSGRDVWSSGLYRLLGVDEAAGEASYEAYLARVHPADRAHVEQQNLATLLGHPVEYEARVVRPDGEVRWFQARAEIVSRVNGGSTVFGTVVDITDRIRLQHDLVAHARRLDEAQRLAGVGSFERDLVTGQETWSDEYYRLLGLQEGSEASWAVYLSRLHPDDRHRVEQLMATHVPGAPLRYEARVLRPDGELRWIAVRAEIQTDENGLAVRTAGTAHDITDRKSAQAELERLAHSDSLTGLANRDRFTDLLQSTLDETCGERATGLLLLDLDGFKDVNDGIGHHAGDLVLQEVARRVQAVLRGGDDVARLGGDEFAVVLPAVGDVGHAIEVASSVLSCLESPFDLDGIVVHVGGSIGIALATARMTSGALLKQADVAMYRAKTLSSRWAVFEPDQDDLAAGRLQMAMDLRAAIERGELEVAYQPILDTRTRRISSFEALARWHHPQKGTVPPDQFIPLAEQADLIVPLTRLVLRKAAAACAGWRDAGHDVAVAVNLSVQAIRTEDPHDMVAAVLSAARLAPERLILEITESSLATESGEVSRVLESLRELGVRLVIDDFGTGYSAMSYLKQLPVEELKIDRSFVRELTTDSRDIAIVRSLVGLAHSLSLRVVAEGVESLDALQALTELGCDYAQGYGIARPMPQSDVRPWLTGFVPPAAARVAVRTPSELLIVDDDEVVRTWLAALAEQAGWQVRVAVSAEDALVDVERSIPDVVILDHHMTGMTGTEAVPHLRARGVDGPILLFTGFLNDAVPSLRVPLDVWPVSKGHAHAVLELLEGYRASNSEGASCSSTAEAEPA
jgi:diguanylate cyclase (GGDEF)-like protein/PAS domain S-box-containing protein